MIELKHYLKGNYTQELVKDLFEKSGYKCYTFGFENNLKYVLHLINEDKSNKKQNEAILRIRTMPDTFAYKDKQGYLFEIKYAYKLDPKRVIMSWNCKHYRKYWNEAHLIFCSPNVDKILTCSIKDIKDDMLVNRSRIGEFYDFSSIIRPLDYEFKDLDKRALNDIKKYIDALTTAHQMIEQENKNELNGELKKTKVQMQ